MRYWQQSDIGESYYGARGRSWRDWSITKWLIVINCVVFLGEFLLGASPNSPLFGPLGLSPHEAARGHIWQFVTYAFLHSPQDLMHILFNMLFLYWFGGEVEKAWGRKRYLIFYLAAAAFAGICFTTLSLMLRNPDAWCIGASGAVMALMMVYALWWPNRIILFMFIFPMRIRTFVIITVIIETMNMMRVNQARNGVANSAHLGGLLFGFVVIKFGPFLMNYLTKQNAGQPGDSSADQRRVDEILDKVHRQGIGSLSWSEKRFLNKYSRRR